MSDISLIKNWHEKAKEDFFSRYIFEYLAFEAFLKKYKYTEYEIIQKAGNTKERSYIQNLKHEKDYNESWITLVARNIELRRIVIELITFLQSEPLASDSNWWNCTSLIYTQCKSINNKGVILNEDDFVNVVEFWYQVRNNLFHAGKNPNNKRDEKLVTFAYSTLSIFFEEILLPEIENKTVYPAIWENFEHKFFTGNAEVMIKIGGSEVCANVYELLFTKDDLFPLILNGKQIDKVYIIDKLTFNLINLYGDPYLLKEEWSKITSRARTSDDKKNLANYFGGIMSQIETIERGVNT